MRIKHTDTKGSHAPNPGNQYVLDDVRPLIEALGIQEVSEFDSEIGGDRGPACWSNPPGHYKISGASQLLPLYQRVF